MHLKASVVLSQEYPTTPPLFSVAVSCGQSLIRDSFTKVCFYFEFVTIKSPTMVVKAFVIKKRDSGYDFGHVTVEDTPQSSAFVCDCFKLIVNLKGSIMILHVEGKSYRFTTCCVPENSLPLIFSSSTVIFLVLTCSD